MTVRAWKASEAAAPCTSPPQVIPTVGASGDTEQDAEKARLRLIKHFRCVPPPASCRVSVDGRRRPAVQPCIRLAAAHTHLTAPL